VGKAWQQTTEKWRFRKHTGRAHRTRSGFERYSMQAVPPIHIGVKDGHVTDSGIPIVEHFNVDAAWLPVVVASKIDDSRRIIGVLRFFRVVWQIRYQIRKGFGELP
jgi:hypothetical protein